MFEKHFYLLSSFPTFQYYSKLKWVGAKVAWSCSITGCHIQPQQHAGSSTHIQQFYPRFLFSTYAILHLKLLLHLVGCSTHLVVYHRLRMLSQACTMWPSHTCGRHIHVSHYPPPLRWGGLHAIIEVLSRASQVLLSSKMVLVPLLLKVYWWVRHLHRTGELLEPARCFPFLTFSSLSSIVYFSYFCSSTRPWCCSPYSEARSRCCASSPSCCGIRQSYCVILIISTSSKSLWPIHHFLFRSIAL